MLSTTQLTLSDPQVVEQFRYVDFALNQSHQQHREPLHFLYTTWEELRTRYFEPLGGPLQIQPPHIVLGDTPLHRFACTTPFTGWGAYMQITIQPDLFFPPTHRDENSRVVRRHPSPGTSKFIEDTLLHEMVHQYLLEVENVDEAGYEGHGPRFTWHANRISSMLGLSGTVVPRRRGAKDRMAFTSAYWPFCLRPLGYYESDVILDVGARSHTQTTSTRSQVALRYLNAEEAILRMAYRMLEEGRYTELKRVIRTMIDYRLAVREPAWLVHEAKPHDHAGTPVSTPVVEWHWLTNNSNTGRYFAESIVHDARFDLLPIFADAIQDVGCEDAVLLDHCRQSREHSGKCWLVKLLAETLAQHTAE